MRIILILILISSQRVFACNENYLDPDGKNVFFYEECLHMNRRIFTEELHQKCKEYSKKQMIENNMIWKIFTRSCIVLIAKENF